MMIFRWYTLQTYLKVSSLVLPLKLFKQISHLMTLLLLALSTIMLSAEYKESQAKTKSTIEDSTHIFGKLSLSTVKSSGATLIELPLGLHQLNQGIQIAPNHAKKQMKSQIKSPQAIRISLLVHGYNSPGYEWIYAIKQLAKVSEVFFLRWDWSLCPKQGAKILSHYIFELQKLYPKHHIEVYGHSYGGVITAIAAANYSFNLPLTANVIASPVAGHPKLEQRCPQKISSLTRNLHAKHHPFNHNLNLYQWRTQKKLDGAFKHMKYNPQLVDWHGEVTQLPEKYKGRRLGHNWSISWVIDEIFERNKE